MKTYLVTVNQGGGIIKPYEVKTDDNYVPASDEMTRLKKAVVSEYKPRHFRQYADPGSCGSIYPIDGDEIREERLDIIAVSRLDL